MRSSSVKKRGPLLPSGMPDGEQPLETLFYSLTMIRSSLQDGWQVTLRPMTTCPPKVSRDPHISRKRIEINGISSVSLESSTAMTQSSLDLLENAQGTSLQAVHSQPQQQFIVTMRGT